MELAKLMNRTLRSRSGLVVLSAIVIVGSFAIAMAGATFATSDAVVFDNVEQQTKEFMGYFESIKLSPEQEAIKKDALTQLPAPCCSDNSSYTCCCPCNMARSIWGLSHYLIAEHGYDAEQLKGKVSEWIRFINPKGFSGDVCYVSGGCFRSFEANGCGGMFKNKVVF